MNNPKGTSNRSLLATLTMAGASLAGMAGLVTGGLLGAVAAIPVTAAAVGYSMGGWASAAAGLILGGIANYLPLYKKAAIIQPAEGDIPAVMDYETVRLCDYAGNACAVTGGIVGAFTGAAVGAGLAGIVTIAETRQAMLNGEDPQDIAARRKKCDNDPFMH